MSEKNIKLIIEYNGTSYCGWQSQKEQKTVQDEIIEAVYKTTGKKVTLTGAGRTDAGVHALGQTANFIINHNIVPEQYQDALNFYLPPDIRIKSAGEVPLNFNARRDALNKRYRYLISREKSALYYNFRWELNRELDYLILKETASYVIGEHDFSPFCVVASLKEDNRCLIEAAFWRKIGPLLVFEIRGNRFLHSMIRSLVGAMVNVATRNTDKNKQNLTLASFKDIIETSTSERIIFTAPAQGLYLVSVGYDKGITE